MLQRYNDKNTQQKRAQTTNRLTCTDDPLLTCTDEPRTPGGAGTAACDDLFAGLGTAKAEDFQSGVAKISKILDPSNCQNFGWLVILGNCLKSFLR